MANDKEPTWKAPVSSLYELEKFYRGAEIGSVAYVISQLAFYYKTASVWKVLPLGIEQSPTGQPTAQTGFGTVSFRTLAERNALPVSTRLETPDQSGKRRLFMPVWVAETKKSYVLHVEGYDVLSSDAKLAALANNANWIVYGAGNSVIQIEQTPDGFTATYSDGTTSNISAGLPTFNWNRKITAPGSFYGITVGGTSLVAGLERLLFVSEAPDATLSASNPNREFGSSNLVTLQYTTTAKTNPISTIIINGDPVIAGSGSVPATTPNNTSKTFTMSVTDGNLTTTKSADVKYYNNRFWFTSTSSLLASTDTQLSSLLQPQSNKEFSESRVQTRTFTPTLSYIVFAWVKAYGDAPSFKVNGLNNTDWNKKEFTYTNVFGYTETYVLFESGNKADGETSIIVS